MLSLWYFIYVKWELSNKMYWQFWLILGGCIYLIFLMVNQKHRGNGQTT